MAILKSISTFLAVVGIIMTVFAKKYPAIGAIGVPIGLLGLLGIYYLS
ncbi:MAG: hypothetical protein AABX11_01605 [Nanoarchaeota archaeon]